MLQRLLFGLITVTSLTLVGCAHSPQQLSPQPKLTTQLTPVGRGQPVVVRPLPHVTGQFRDGDVRAAWATVAPQYAGRKVVLYGRSLGTGLAAGLAAEMGGTKQAPDLTVLVSPYTSMAALATDHYPWVPQVLLRYPMRTDALIAQIHSPLLLIHGTQDVLISPHHSDTLQALAPHAKKVLVQGAAHNDLQNFDAYLNSFARALAAL